MLPISLILTLLSLAAPAASPALVVGIGDQNPAVFDNGYVVPLAPDRARYITPYDSVFRDRGTVDAWMDAARNAGMEVVVAFNPPKTMKCPNLGGARGCRPISGARFKAAFRAFHRRYPEVRIVQPWNEVNNLTQPTAHHPEAVVTYYQIVRSVCPRCTVLGADIQDLPNMVPYTTRLLQIFRARKVRTPRIWGIHNYTDVNRFIKDRNTSLRRAVQLLPGKIWLTETGGLFRFQPQNARQTFRPDLRRQKRAMETLFRQAGRFRGKVARIYLYHWFGAPRTNRWDSGVLDVRGRPRPVYAVLERYRHLFR
jgi:hypothetical protein